MIVVLNPGVDEVEIKEVEDRLKRLGFGVHRSTGENRTILGAIGAPKEDARDALQVMPCVEKVVIISQPFKLVSREYKREKTEFEVGGTLVGGDQVILVAGPCAVEGREEFLEAAERAKEAGANFLRGGAYKPRT